MATRNARWPIWKIVLVLLGFAGGAAGFFVAGHLVGVRTPLPKESTPVDPEASARYGMSNMLTLFGALCVAMALICGGWLVIRYYQSIPAWKKRAKLPAHRRK